MSTEYYIALIVLLALWWLALLIYRANKRRAAREMIRAVRNMRRRGSWLASYALQDAYGMCYDAGLIEEYQDLHEWFYGRKG